MSVAQLEVREVELEAPGGGLWGEALHRIIRNPGAIVGAAIAATFVLVAIFAPLLAPYDPSEQNLDLVADGCCPGPSREHLLGADDLGRDELSHFELGDRHQRPARRIRGLRRP